MSRHGNDHGVESRGYVITACLFGLCLAATSAAVPAGRRLPEAPPAAATAPGQPTERRYPQPAPASRREYPWECLPQGQEYSPVSQQSVRSSLRKDTVRRVRLPSTPGFRSSAFKGPRDWESRSWHPNPARYPSATATASRRSVSERGVGYRLRLSNITERPGVELFPVVEVVGHLHRPEGDQSSQIPDPDCLQR